MTDNFGPNVSRVLSPSQASFKTVIWQQGRPPLDSELSLAQQIAAEWDRLYVLANTPSGWLDDAINPQDSYSTSPSYSNWFKFGSQQSGEQQSYMWAVVNGWLIPVTSTLTGAPPGTPNNTDTWNRITLPPPPANTGDARIDFAFLEVWQARVAPNPATSNKPAASAIWRFGNVEGGTSFIADDIQDPAIGFETTQRVQLQYRIRIVSGLVGLAGYPDGFDPSVVKGQGAATSPTSFVYTNMREELGDPGLWRAGDGTQNSLGTVDGYVYAIPLCTVFRRNSVSWAGDPGQNLNGGFNRNPTAVDRTGYKTFSTIPALSGALSATALSVSLASVANIPMPLTPATPVVIQIDDEIMLYSAITGSTLTLSARGAFGSKAEAHKSGAVVKVLSGRPDGLYSDQIAKNDILDLRHVVSASGFDYQALLKGNLDKVLRGQLHSTWKRTGGGPQGAFVAYQDKLSATAGALGVTKLDAPDGIRQIFSDAAALQPVVIPISAPTSTGAALSIGGTLGAAFNTVTINHTAGSGFQPSDVIKVPLNLFLNSLPGSDVDQVRLIADQNYMSIRFMGETTDLATNQYALSSDGSGNLLITLTGSFSPRTTGAFITLHVQYGPGRGLSRRPDAVHSVTYLSASPNILVQQQGVPANNQELRTTWSALWSKYQGSLFNGHLPVTAEAYVDLGSKTIIAAPFRLQAFTQQDAGSRLKTVQLSTSSTSGAMPANNLGGNPKWGSTDPLSVFSGYSDPVNTRASMVVILPRRLMGAFGEVRVPILYSDSGNLAQGINFGVFAPKGSVGASVANYVPQTSGGGSTTYGVFSTQDLNTNTPVTYNTSFTFGNLIAGMRFFTDTRGLARQGLELPPFYGIARLFAVYEAQDYKANGSSFDPTTRNPDPSPGRATNLLRQNFSGPTFWIESDVDGDPTFILNADAIDITQSPNTISAFGSGNYVIEASIIGFDRGAFDLSQDCRMVLARGRSEGLTAGSILTNPTFILPGAPEIGDEIAINYSRTPYQGDAWGSQQTQSDIGYKPGPLTTALRFQLLNTVLNQAALSRPNQKPLEVLASIPFMTSLGTGRMSGSIPSTNADFRNVGYEPWSLPTSSVAPRPTITPSALATAERPLTIGSEYLGCTERLPLGALFRDKDFRGNYVSGAGNALGQMPGPFSMGFSAPGIMATSLAPVNNQDYTFIPAQTASVSSGSAGEIIIHVDGEAGNYNLLTNFRTNRGGSAFTGSGFAGGDVGALLPSSAAASTSGGVLSGLAMLVRNNVTSVGANEVSAGNELMMLIATTAHTQGASGTFNTVQVSTSGTGEGYSAVDLYRISGHPLTIDSSREVLDPSTITLAAPSDLLT
jgi:hypothetical protein